MSHFPVAVFLDGSRTLNDLLAPYDESKEVPHYIPKEQIIREKKAEMEEYKQQVYDEFLKDKETYKRKCNNNPAHLSYLTEVFPKELSRSDDEIYNDYIKGYIEDDGDKIMPDGSIFSTYNPNAKWDWWDIGGRWSNELITKSGKCNRAKVKDILFSEMPDFSTYAVITPDGEWHSPGDVGWFGVTSETKEERDNWEASYKERFIGTADPEWEIVVVDCHI